MKIFSTLVLGETYALNFVDCCVSGFFCGKFLGFSGDSTELRFQDPEDIIFLDPTPIYTPYTNEELCFEGGFRIRGHAILIYTVG